MVSTPQKCSLVRLRCSQAGCYHPAQVCYMVWRGREGGEGRRRWGRGGWGGGSTCLHSPFFSPPPTRSLAPLVSASVASPHGVALSRLTHLPVCSAIYLPPSLTSTPRPPAPPPSLSRSPHLLLFLLPLPPFLPSGGHHSHSHSRSTISCLPPKMKKQ